MALADAAGRVLAEDARSAVDLPPFPALGDGRLRAPRRRRARGRCRSSPASPPAGRRRARSSRARRWRSRPAASCRKAPTPSSRSRTSRSATTTVSCPAPLSTAKTSATAGGDLAAGDTVVVAGHAARARRTSARSRPPACRRVRCHRVPRVVVVVTGTRARARRASRSARARSTTRTASSSRRRCAARAPRSSACRRSGTTPTRRAPRSSAVSRPTCSSRRGGVSVGVYDLVRAAEAELGVEEVFWRVAVRPGKPIAFGVRGSTLVFGLPGNPVSSLVGFELFVRPALLALQGVPRPGAGVPARPARARDEADRRARLAAACAHARRGRRRSCSTRSTGQESHMIAQAATADALVLVPRGDGELEAGSAVSYLGSVARSQRRRAAAPLAHRVRARAHDARCTGPARPLAPRGPGTARSGRPRPRRAARRGDAPASATSTRRRLDVADGDEREQVPRARRGRARSARRASSDEQRDPAQPERVDGEPDRQRAPSAAAGSQSQACSAGSRKSSAKGSSPRRAARPRPAPSSATVWPASCSCADDLAARHEPPPRDQPARERRSSRSASQREHVPVARGGGRGFGGRGGPSGQAPSSGKTRENDPDEEPEQQPRAQRPRGAAERRSAGGGTARRGRRSRRRTAPAARSARARSPSRARCARRTRRSSSCPASSSRPLVERAQRSPAPSGRAARACACASRPALSPNDGGGRLPAGRQRDRGDPARRRTAPARRG